MLQTQIGKHLLQSAVFILKLFELSDIGGFHAAVFSLPVAVGSIRNSILPAHLFDLTTSLYLFQNLDDLGYLYSVTCALCSPFLVTV